jgi:ATP-dependent RNA helicase SUPV3L1/SUV3
MTRSGRSRARSQVALITGEERIEPPTARYLLCTAEAMPRDGGNRAFVALDEAQLGADPERGHIFTDRLLHARGREETMLLGSATLEPMVQGADPRGVEVRSARAFRPSAMPDRSSCRACPAQRRGRLLDRAGLRVAEMLRRFRGGAAVVMGALSPETRNRQVALFQSGEVDYIVATDAIGMGLNLDLDPCRLRLAVQVRRARQRRLTPRKWRRSPGAPGGTSRTAPSAHSPGAGARTIAFTDEEVYAIEEHRFAPLTQPVLARGRAAVRYSWER